MYVRCKQELVSVAILVWMLAALFPVTADAAEKPARGSLKKIKIAYSSISGTMAPAWVTYEAGIFRKYGLDVELVFSEGGYKAVKALVAGNVDIAQVGAAAVLQSNLNGSDVVMIAGVLNTMPYQFIVEKNITRPEQLKGKAVAVSRFGGSSDFATRYAIETFGLVPQKDVDIREIGSQPARLAALINGEVQGVMLSVPKTLEAKKMGFSVLADLRMLGLEYQHTGLATSKAFIESQPELVGKVMRAYVEGIHYYKTHRNEALAILQKYLKTDDIEALAETYEVLGLILLPEKPYPTLRGIRTMLQRLARKKKYAKAKTAQPEKFVNLTFIKELDSSGFIDRLYKTTPIVATREERRTASPPASVKEEAKPAPAVAKPVPPPPKMPDKEEAKPAPAVAKPVPPPPKMPDKEEAKPAPAVAKLVPPPPKMPDKEEAKPAPAVAKLVPPPPRAQDVAQEYTVKAGDTLSHLALRYYRDAAKSKWMKIYEANKETVRNPNFIYIGQKIMIPPDDAKI